MVARRSGAGDVHHVPVAAAVEVRKTRHLNWTIPRAMNNMYEKESDCARESGMNRWRDAGLPLPVVVVAVVVVAEAVQRLEEDEVDAAAAADEGVGVGVEELAVAKGSSNMSISASRMFKRVMHQAWKPWCVAKS